MVLRLLLRPRALDELEGFLRGRTLVDDGADAADHADGIRRLPDVPAHVHAFRTISDRVVHHLELVDFGLDLRAAHDADGVGTRPDVLRLDVAVKRLDLMRPELGVDGPREVDGPRVPL